MAVVYKIVLVTDPVLDAQIERINYGYGTGKEVGHG